VGCRGRGGGGGAGDDFWGHISLYLNGWIAGSEQLDLGTNYRYEKRPTKEIYM